MANFGWLEDLVAQIVFEDTNARAQRRRWNLVGLDAVDDATNSWLTISPDLAWIASQITAAPSGAVTGDTFAIGSSSDLVRADHVHRFGRDPTLADVVSVRLTYDSAAVTGDTVGLRIQETTSPGGGGESQSIAVVDSAGDTVLAILSDATIRGENGAAGDIEIASGSSASPGTTAGGDVRLEVGQNTASGTGYIRCTTNGTTFFAMRKASASLVELRTISDDLLIQATSGKDIVSFHTAPNAIPTSVDRAIFIGDADTDPSANNNDGAFLYSSSPGQLRAMAGQNYNHDADITYTTGAGSPNRVSSRKEITELTVSGGSSDTYSIEVPESHQFEIFVSCQAYDGSDSDGGGVTDRAYLHRDGAGLTRDGQIISSYVGNMLADSDSIDISASGTDAVVEITNNGANEKVYRLRIEYHWQGLP